MNSPATQLLTPIGVACLALYLALFAIPCVWLWRADPRRRLVAIAFAAAAVAVRLVHFGDTPGGVSLDETLTLLELEQTGVWDWKRFFGEGTFSGGSGWCLLPWYLAYALTHNLLAIRALGTAWAAVLAVGAVVVGGRYFGTAGGAIAAAVLTFVPWSLWLSRHAFGAEILVQELYLIAAVEALRSQPRWRSALACGLMLAMLQLTYIGARITVLFPLAMILVGPWVKPVRSAAFLLVAYATAAFLILPHVLTGPRHFWGSGQMAGYDVNLADWWHMLEKAGAVLASLGSPDYSIRGTLALPGAQALSPVVLVLIVGGACAALWGPARGLVVAALLGAVPSWLPNISAVDNVHVGNSHRMMMMLVPMALLAGGAVGLVRSRYRTAAAGVLVSLIAITGVQRRLSPQFWEPIRPLGEIDWALRFRNAAEREVQQHPSVSLRVYPGDGSIWLLAQERGLHPRALDLGAPDFALRDPMTVIWRRREAEISQLFGREQDGEMVGIEVVTPAIVVTRLPHGFQGLLGDPPHNGWQFHVRCGNAAEVSSVTPFVLESPTFRKDASARGPCRLRWAGRALARIEKAVLDVDLLSDGRLAIDDVVIPLKAGGTGLPTIEPGQRISLEMHTPTRDAVAELLVPFGDAFGLLTWDAIAPEVDAPAVPRAG